MSLREWLIAIGTLVILGIVIDGIRRMRRARKDAMAISSGMGADELKESPLDDAFNPELPNGGARPITRDTLQERGYLKKSGRSRFANPEPKPTRPIVSSRPVKAEPQASETEPASVKASDQTTQPDELSGADKWEQATGESGWSAIDDEPDVNDETLSQARTVNPSDDSEADVDTTDDRSDDKNDDDQAPPIVTSEVEEDTARRAAPKRKSSQPVAGANRPDAQEVIVINVLSKPDQAFAGPALKKLFEACGLEHGDMDIYHRHEGVDTNSPVQFSVANAVEPGTFRPRDMATMSTPGISFFMSMPGPSNAMQAFDFMHETAQCVVRNLGGELKDERRSVMTPQTVEHCRQRIREYERKRHSQHSQRV
ncbi:cell division protein ZipA [Marinobacter caseinilyticus]|uniref:cell division protein ZipA n=1 Tax=Marinobacter caseinilyticus TaxID=2692195 RepID=UPI001409CAB4|nr:cell division protein ZipA [Marinobacter caseinilyticus]